MLKRLIVGATLVGVVLVTAAVAVANIPSSDGTIHACIKDGKVRVIDAEAGQTCTGSEQALVWNQTGPQGPPGPGGSGSPEYVRIIGHVTDTLVPEISCPAGKFVASYTTLNGEIGAPRNPGANPQAELRNFSGTPSLPQSIQVFHNVNTESHVSTIDVNVLCLSRPTAS